MKQETMSAEKLKASLAIDDLSEYRSGHAIALAVKKLTNAIAYIPDWPKPIEIRGNRIVKVADNYDRLLYPVNNLGRSSVYTRYVSKTEVLRTQTTAHIPDLLLNFTGNDEQDIAWILPGICYRRDVVDKTHTSEPHQMDVWRLKRGLPKLYRDDLLELIDTIVQAIKPSAEYRCLDAVHPYTKNGLEVEVKVGNDWLEILECGEIPDPILKNANLDPNVYSGLALGVGLDRLIMTLKGIDDIRLLRSKDPRVISQMQNLNPYIPVSKYPAIRQDLSVCMANGTEEEDICEIIRDTLGKESSSIERVEILSKTAYNDLPPQAIERLGILRGQLNYLIRIVLRSHEKNLKHEESNEMRDRIYRALHQGESGYVL